MAHRTSPAELMANSFSEAVGSGSTLAWLQRASNGKGARAVSESPWEHGHAGWLERGGAEIG